MLYPYKLWACPGNPDHFYRLSPDKKHYLTVFRYSTYDMVPVAYETKRIDFRLVKPLKDMSWSKSYSVDEWKLVYSPINIGRITKICN